MATYEQRYYEAREALREINNLIYAVGAPLGSGTYFQIREIAARYEREAQNENPTPRS